MLFLNRYSAEAVANAREKKEGVTEDGIEDAFDLVGEVSLGVGLLVMLQIYSINSMINLLTDVARNILWYFEVFCILLAGVQVMSLESTVHSYFP